MHHGDWLRGVVREASWPLGAIVLAVAATPATAADRFAFNVPAGRLDNAIIALSEQAHVSIGIADSSLPAMRVKGVRGRLTVSRALERLLDDSGASYVTAGSDIFRIIRRPESHPKSLREPGPVTSNAAIPDIIVTASKREAGLADFPATVSILGPDRLNSTGGTSGSDAIVNASPSLSSTHLGPGRNKLFIRGVADSSFTGPTQATVGQYFGEMRLNYNAPDPDLTLYDIERVEVLEGPQGALYGTASLGGIVRIIPNAPDAERFAASLDGGLSSSRHGAPGSDVAGMANVPVIDGIVALRAVGYRSIDGGYIDDIGRDLNNVNRSTTSGGRMSLRVTPGDGWVIDGGTMLQNIDNADGQYAESNEPRLSRSSALAQPFDNDYKLSQIIVTKRWKDLSLISATGSVHHHIGQTFDASPLYPGPSPVAFHQNNRITLFSNENRISHLGSSGAGWLIGTSYLSSGENLTRTLGPIALPSRITGVRNRIREVAIFGEATIAIARRWTVSAGGRFSYSRHIGDPLDTEGDDEDGPEPKQSRREILPSLAIRWRPISGLVTYIRYQEGFRPGGLSVAGSGTGLIVQRFEGDSISTIDAGLRLGDREHDRFSAAASFSYGRWKDIQADLIDSAGLPFTSNIGTGDVLGWEFSATWRPLAGLTADASVFFNNSTLAHPVPGLDPAEKNNLPNVADVGARAAVRYATILTGDLSFAIDASGRFFGRSRLGVGPTLSIPQGRYVDTALRARIGTERVGVTFDLTNLLNVAGNRFSLGNPFGVMDGLQTTPLRPRTIRAGVDARF
jgi:outer membrane receptor protein involved in Fe transport